MQCYYKCVHSIRINNYEFWDAARIISKSCFFSETEIQTHRRFRLRRIFVGYVFFFFFFDKPLSTLQLFRMNVSSLTSANKKKECRIFLNFAKIIKWRPPLPHRQVRSRFSINTPADRWRLTTNNFFSIFNPLPSYIDLIRIIAFRWHGGDRQEFICVR